MIDSRGHVCAGSGWTEDTLPVRKYIGCWDCFIWDEFDFVVGVTLFGECIAMVVEDVFVFLEELLDFRGYRFFFDLFRLKFG